MSNKYNKFITALFCTFLGGMLVVSTLLPVSYTHLTLPTNSLV